jgi:hypothetical protein
VDEGAQRLVGGDGWEDAARGVVDAHAVVLGEGTTPTTVAG